MEYFHGLAIVVMLAVPTTFAQGLSPCGSPPSIEHGYVRFLRSGRLAQYFCDYGFQTFGMPMISCTGGSWKGKLPACVAPGCSLIRLPLHATRIERMRGAVVEHRCADGFRMEGEATIYCDGDSWSGVPPTCVGTGPDLITPTPRISTTPLSPPYPPDNAIEDPGNVTTGMTDSESSEDVNGMRKPIFVGRSDKPPVFHSKFLKNIGSGGVLPLYRVPGAEEHEEDARRNPNIQESPTIERQIPLGQRSPIVPPMSPVVGYPPYYRPGPPYARMYPQYPPYGIMYPQQGRYLPPYRQPIYPSQFISSGSAMRPIFLAREDDSQPPNEAGQPESTTPDTNGQNSQNTFDAGRPPVFGSLVQRTPPVVRYRGGDVPKIADKEDPNIGESRSKANPDSKTDVRQAGRDYSRTVSGVLQEKEEPNSERARSCPPARKPLQGFYTTRPIPRDYEGNEYLYLIEYHCLSGLTLVGGSNISYCTKKGRWSGTLPRCQKIQKCEAGYTLLSGRCVDVNECARNNGGCRYKCINFPGEFRCVCHEGFRDDGSSCVDIDECANEDVCHHVCQNTPGSFRCSCRHGYKLRPSDQKTCVDINECIEQRPCEHMCQNTRGSFRCACHTSFRLQEDGRTCSQVCQPGYVMKLDTETNTKICADEDECMEHKGLGNCEQVCNNTAGSFFCSCARGYKLNEDGQTCADVNECDEIYPCEYGCINALGSYSCSCPEDQVLSDDKLFCVGCKLNLYMNDGECVPCPENSITEEIGATTRSDCTCRPGYKGNPQMNIPCTDIDECLDENYGCSHNCVNTAGSVFCECPVGYTLDVDGRNCVDADECNDRFGVCGRGGMCQNTVGGYNCTCIRGFHQDVRNNRACVDVNECKIKNGGCQARCENLQPGYRCSCYTNWKLGADGRSCVPLHGSCPPLKPLQNGRVLPEVPCVRLPSVIMGRVCFYACNSGYGLVGSHRMQCRQDGWSSAPPECVPQSHCSPLDIPVGVRVVPPTCAHNSSIPWRMCVFSCQNSTHMMKGSRTTRCIPKSGWKHKPPTCLSRESIVSGPSLIPRIQCPRDMDVSLAPGQSFAKVTLPRPVSNMEITEQRNDGSASRNIFPAGATSVKFTAFTSDRQRQASCVMRVYVRDKEAPTIQRCSGSVNIESRQEFPEISWQAPLFRDNVEVTSVKQSRNPPGNMTWGIYSVSYTASDAAGNMAECAFSVIIRRPKASRQGGLVDCGQPKGPANGDASCHTWARGVYCVPRCHAGFAFERLPPTYLCGEEGTWSPGNVIPDCIDMRLAHSEVTERRTATTVALTTLLTTTTSTTEQTTRVTDIGDTVTTQQTSTKLPAIKILERPTFYKVPLQDTETLGRPRKRPLLPPPVVGVIRRVSQPRLIKLLPETNDCPQGQVPEINDRGRELCVDCPTGHYRPRIASAIKCRACSPGFYQDRPGKGYCNRCPNHIPGTYTSAMHGQEDLMALTSVEQCERIEGLIEQNSRNADSKRAIARRRSRLLRLR